MKEPASNGEALNLEALSLDELERRLQLASDAPESPPPLPEPKTVQRCDSARRELLQNRFPPVDEL